MTVPIFPSDAFVGAAEFYLRYRPPFPRTLIDDLLARASGSERARLLDLACGPGRVTLALAPFFKEVQAVDLEPEMIAVARREAARLHANNITWNVGRAEELAAPDHALDLITIGDAFHRLDQARVIKKSLIWLRPGGAIAILGSRDTLIGTEPWHDIAGSVVRRWTQRAIVHIPASQTGPAYCEAILREAGFCDVGSFDFAVPHVWTIEDILGNLHSTSYASKGALGANTDKFTEELSQALLSCNPEGTFRESLRFAYTFGRKTA